MSAKKFSLVLLLLFTVLLSGCLGNTFGGPRLAKLVITTDTCSLKPGDSGEPGCEGVRRQEQADSPARPEVDAVGFVKGNARSERCESSLHRGR